MEGQRKIKDGHIVVKNPLAYELPKREVVIKSGRTLYRFTGSYDGQRALPSKVLRLMEQDNLQKDLDEKDKERKNGNMQSCTPTPSNRFDGDPGDGRLPAGERSRCQGGLTCARKGAKSPPVTVV